MPLFVASDIHGHRSEFRDALNDAGLTDPAGDWAGGDARLWLLGDYFDRGPDGVGVIDDLRRLAGQAAAAGGEVGALLGNHEVQLLSAHRYGSQPLPGYHHEPDGFRGMWQRWGGQESDMLGLDDERVAWLLERPAMALVDGHLLVHADTTRYLELGGDIAEVNKKVGWALTMRGTNGWLYLCGLICDRGAFREDEAAAAKLLAAFGGDVVVHGHSTLISHFGVAAGEVREPVRYAGGRAVAVDGGVFEGGRIPATRLTETRAPAPGGPAARRARRRRPARRARVRAGWSARPAGPAAAR